VARPRANSRLSSASISADEEVRQHRQIGAALGVRVEERRRRRGTRVPALAAEHRGSRCRLPRSRRESLP
jgi:hypothetical protein